MRSFLLNICILCALLCVSPQLHAQAPLPPNKQKEVGDLQRNLAARKADQDNLSQKLGVIEGEIKDTKNQLVKTAQSVQQNEQSLIALDKQILELEARKKDIDTTLKDDRASIAELILALERLRRMPPEAMIARPGAPLETAQSAMLLRELLPQIQAKADDLNTKLKELNILTVDLNKQKESALKVSQALKAEQSKLTALVVKRTDMYKATHKDFEEQARQVEKISKQSNTLADLVRRLDKKKAEAARERLATKAALPLDKIVMNEKPPKAGEARIPVSGVIKTKYNEADIFGAPSQGIEIESREGALVIAPMGGIIRFAGHFRNYGNMVIIEHEKGWHSLVAGLEKIDTVVGQSVNAGEPLGLLHKSSTDQKPVLYYELRQNGKAVNPAMKLSDLS